MKRLFLLMMACLALFLGSLPILAQCQPRTVAAHDIPQAAIVVLAQVRKHGEPLPGYVGGRRFGNYARNGEAKLPTADGKGRAVTYQEWDIHPKVPGRNRGAERLVTGSDGRAWYTADHYCTFTEIR